MVRWTALLVSCLVISSFTFSYAEETLPNACRSVHLFYESTDCDLFYNEVCITESVPGTYFCVAGFNMGYFGLQELADGRKVAIFSVWEPSAGDDPDAVESNRRVQQVSAGDGVVVRRFGGEGTGGQSFFDFDWKLGERYRFLVTASLHESRTHYTGYVYLPDQQRWQQMATFSTLAHGHLIRGQYSFVEDFRRDTKSVHQIHAAQYGNGWARRPSGDWVPLLQANFTADSTELDNIDAGVSDNGRFFLQTGGTTTSEHSKLGDLIKRVKPEGQQHPDDLPTK